MLVVDDNVDAAATLEHAAALARPRDARGARRREALSAAEQFQPDVVLLDIGMPGMDGYEVARRLRARKHAPPLHIIAVTGWGRKPTAAARAKPASTCTW